MRDAGVDLLQGYLFGRPVPIAEFGPQAAITLETLSGMRKATADSSLRKLDASKLRA
jgi:hypothetical protein